MLTSSSLTGKGLDEVWQAVLDHRAYLEAHGGLAGRRNAQQLEWLWSLVEDAVLDGVRRSPRVRAIRKHVETLVGHGELSALEGAEQVLESFVLDVPQIWPTEGASRS